MKRPYWQQIASYAQIRESSTSQTSLNLELKPTIQAAATITRVDAREFMCPSSRGANWIVPSGHQLARPAAAPPSSLARELGHSISLLAFPSRRAQAGGSSMAPLCSPAKTAAAAERLYARELRLAPRAAWGALKPISWLASSRRSGLAAKTPEANGGVRASARSASRCTRAHLANSKAKRQAWIQTLTVVCLRLPHCSGESANSTTLDKQNQV